MSLNRYINMSSIGLFALPSKEDGYWKRIYLHRVWIKVGHVYIRHTIESQPIHVIASENTLLIHDLQIQAIAYFVSSIFKCLLYVPIICVIFCFRSKILYFSYHILNTS